MRENSDGAENNDGIQGLFSIFSSLCFNGSASTGLIWMCLSKISSLTDICHFCSPLYRSSPPLCFVVVVDLSKATGFVESVKAAVLFLFDLFMVIIWIHCDKKENCSDWSKRMKFSTVALWINFWQHLNFIVIFIPSIFTIKRSYFHTSFFCYF